ncbi:MAG: PD-(D/E)XK nuclease family protein [Candidatus Aminicenantes bacterium]|nr:PD-(D/E)XK nuclease family protein [Candidatus Aminicenantes bacterium]
MLVYSHSRLETFENCPLQYWYKYIDKRKPARGKSIEAYLGSCVHETLEKLYTDLRFEKILTEDDLIAYYNRVWEIHWDDDIHIVKEYARENFQKMGERFVREYYRRHSPFKKGKVLGLETKKVIKLDKEGNIGFHVRIDRLMDMGDGLYEVHDYKTSSTMPAQEELDADRQLAIYSLWVREQFKDVRDVRLVWHFLAFDKEIESFRTLKELESLRQKVQEDIRALEAAKEFPSRVSRLCDWCVYQPVCPEWKHAFDLEKKKENEYLDDPGLKLVDEYVRIKGDLDRHNKEARAVLGKLKEALITFSEKKQVKVISGTKNQIRISRQESYKFPQKNTEEREKLMETLKKMGRFEEVADLDVTALIRILNSGEWQEEELAGLLKFVEKKEESYKLTVSQKK